MSEEKKPILITEAEAARLVGFSLGHLRNRRQKKNPLFPYRRVGGKILYREADLLEAVEKIPLVTGKPNESK